MALDQRSKEIRRSIIRMVAAGRRGHIGPAMSLAEILRVLYDSFLRYRTEQPHWPHRDRLILSKGHGGLALYAILAHKGFFPHEELDTFGQAVSRLCVHPERGHVPGVEASTGALGHGLPMGVGMALAARIRKQAYRVVVITGDGEINEGSVWEAALSAAKHRLSNLIVFVDYNKFQAYGPTREVLDLEPLADKWAGFGFHVEQVDGHDIPALERLMTRLPPNPEKPTAVICHTIKGRGIDFAEAMPEKWHHKSRIPDEDIEAMYGCLAE
ncbi:MAG: transketolase subunit A [Candidatus Kentron sp. G]|nr:MAG: transketolase subunit A [Candidatus Kentron sp. G]VFN06609.1 MAG: transketolase subunit A [Candidatus Kentron sp. G]VFN07610.1 MAG: transketolase subunit A [Candidatus Kentron sp. G]